LAVHGGCERHGVWWRDASKRARRRAGVRTMIVACLAFPVSASPPEPLV
jgi:hypothetical protein